MDEIDVKILKCLRNNARENASVISDKVNMSVSAVIERRAVPVLPIFDMIQSAGRIDERDMFNTFNMGVGMSLVVASADLDRAMAVLEQAGEAPVLLGHTAAGEGVTLC